MTIFDLLFVVLFLASVVALVSILIMLVRGPGPAAKRLFLLFGGTSVVYLGIVFITAAATSQAIIAFNQEECFDEMCFSVSQVQTSAQLGSSSSPISANGVFYVVRRPDR